MNLLSTEVTEVIGEAFESSCQSKPSNCTSKAPWWNKKLGKLRTKVRRAFQ